MTAPTCAKPEVSSIRHDKTTHTCHHSVNTAWIASTGALMSTVTHISVSPSTQTSDSWPLVQEACTNRQRHNSHLERMHHNRHLHRQSKASKAECRVFAAMAASKSTVHTAFNSTATNKQPTSTTKHCCHSSAPSPTHPISSCGVSRTAKVSKRYSPVCRPMMTDSIPDVGLHRQQWWALRHPSAVSAACISLLRLMVGTLLG
jgi:hypothetical protein